MVDRTSQTCPSSFKGKNQEEAIPGAREDQFTLRDSSLYALGGTNVHLKDAHENKSIFTSLARAALKCRVSRQVDNSTL